VKPAISFTTACLCELCLLGAAILWAYVFREPVLAHIRWNVRDIVAGIVAAVPLFAFLVWVAKSRSELIAEHRNLVRTLVRPLAGNWSVLQIAAVSACAGIAEEAFFRGAIQASLEGRIGVKLALVVASIAFGAAHPITRTYVVAATFIGAYLGGLFAWTGNLLPPILCHTVYDFGALLYFRRKGAEH
jgi:uncharacterized protein